jgi:cyclic beta-1,2-glucan synthetase
MWDHCIAGFRFLRDGVGVGPHGLVRSCRGDWNDYLTPVGAGGTGESMMNTGMAARACDTLARLASRRGEADLAEEIGAYLKDLRDAAGRCFDRRQFVRGYTDAGKPVGSADSGRVFLNAQSWPALGGCGTSGQRHAALWTALEHCRTDLGLCLLSRPYPSPPPADESLLPIPAGEGENGGVWPQTVAWAIWALAENGLADEALTVWRAMTLRHHYARFPKTPFGIFNGPDCYNSHLAGERAHWTQIQLWNRQVHTPMNPAVAWQAFALRRINEASR